MATEAFAPAKINLTLHVTGQQADGYHLLDSLVVFADVGDRLWFEPGTKMSLEVTGPFAEGVPTDARNLVWQAAAAAGWSGNIKLEKNLPHGAGIGGGSSDAAALLRHLGRPELAASLGADVPVCYAATAQRMRGIGEVLSPLRDMTKIWAVLANPGVGVATADVFNGLHQKQNPAMPDVIPRFHEPDEMSHWLTQMRNDLEAPAIAVQPMIKDVLNSLRRLPGAGLCRMSGSGTTCFALLESRESAVSSAQEIQAAHPNWWVAECALR